MPKTKQLDLNKKVVSPVSVKKTPVNYVKEDADAGKFVCSMRDDKRAEAEEEEDLESYVRQHLRPKKGEKIAKGETDDAVGEILKMLEED